MNTQITDTLVSFDTSKLLKEKGFNIKCHYARFISDSIPVNNETTHNWNLYPEGYSIPTQSLAQKWLREVHNIHINIKHRPHSQKFSYTITSKYETENDGELYCNIYAKFDTYEQVLEEALQQALKLIK